MIPSKTITVTRRRGKHKADITIRPNSKRIAISFIAGPRKGESITTRHYGTIRQATNLTPKKVLSYAIHKL
jgi:hypothetical protein